MYCSHEMSEVIRFIETESRIEGSGKVRVGGGERLLYNGSRVSV